MKRTIATAVAILMLLFAFSPQAAQTGAQASPVQTEITDTEDLPRRQIQPSRSTRTPVVPTVQAGDTYGALAKTHCGEFSAWTSLQSANGWPERRIPVGAALKVVCDLKPVVADPLLKRQPIPPVAAPVNPSAHWVHPLASGKRGRYPNCYRSDGRPGHNGVDIPEPKGTPIRSVSSGTVHHKAYQPGGAGYYVAIYHGDGIYSRYHHLTSHSPLAKGASVAVGQVIGYVGITGNATGYHLHFELFRGGYGNSDHINPSPFLRQRGIEIGC